MDLYDSPPSLSLSPSPRTSVSFSSEDSDPNLLIDDHHLYPDSSMFQNNILPAIHLPMPHPKSHSQWPPLPHSHLPPHHLPSPASPPFVGELYDPMHMEDMASSNSDSPGASAHCTYPSPPATLFRNPHDWSMGGSAGLHDHMDHNGSIYRRASYPYVRHDDSHHHGIPGEHHSLKMENASPVIVPTQHILPAPNSFYGPPDSRPGSSHSHISSTGFMPPHPVIHTDDAASKETQFLRRRCFNCHQTEPPSWRRSTLNPGKIVCNKCGLYERTHLRARPHRFDELRASNKARKASQMVAPYPPQPPKMDSPKNRPLASPAFVKREPPMDNGMSHSLSRSRRGSTASSVSSGPSGVSDWDESVSVYNSNSSAASSTYSSPVITPFSIPNHPSPSPSFEGGNSGMPIRLPSNPMVGMNAGGSPGIQRSVTPAKSHTSPYYPERRGQTDRRYTTGTLPSYDSPPRWDGEPQQGMDKDLKAIVN